MKSSPFRFYFLDIGSAGAAEGINGGKKNLEKFYVGLLQLTDVVYCIIWKKNKVSPNRINKPFLLSVLGSKLIPLRITDRTRSSPNFPVMIRIRCSPIDSCPFFVSSHVCYLLSICYDQHHQIYTRDTSTQQPVYLSQMSIRQSGR